jgi:hypothetical protein
MAIEPQESPQRLQAADSPLTLESNFPYHAAR